MKSLLHRHFFPLSTWFITLFIILRSPICFSSSLEWYNTCGSYFSCGNVTRVGYPFWGGHLRPQNCGYRELELTCENHDTIKLEIMGMKYHVLYIDQTTQTLQIVREDFVQGICLQKFINTTMDYQLYEYGLGTMNVTILYGCPPPFSQVQGQFTCRVKDVSETDGYPELGVLGPSGRNTSVVVPVLESLAEQIGNLSLSQVTKEGFKVMYKVENGGLCTKCEASNGRCGFDPSENKTTCLCPDGFVGFTPCSSGSTPSKKHRLFGHALTESQTAMLASFSAVATVMLITLFIYFIWRYSKDSLMLEVSQRKTKEEVEAFLRNCGITGPKRYTYTDLKRITNSFKDKLGEGGYGTVYGGRLHNGNLVAVKNLKKSKGDTMEFINEVASIGMTNHKNIVTLVGFCYEGHKRALVYDFMPNGSLEKFVYGGNNNQSLAWEKLFQIAVGIARGLEYLHQGCNTRILHFDIKPHNILLDENFCPKISDFGLAKSCPQKESIISMSGARGTVGYIAPEVFLRGFGGVSQKSDVYSYGMLVLDMVGCRKKSESEVECSSEQYFPQWIYKQLEQEEVLDHQDILTDEERELWRKMVLVSLWCIQTSPQSRPTMTRVVEMLEGTSESLQIPPMPTLASPPRSLSQQESSPSHTISIS